MCGKACSCKFNNFFHDAQCVSGFVHHLMHMSLICNTYQSLGFEYQWNLDFIGPLNLIVFHNQYVLVMIKHFFKWIELSPL